MYETTSNDVAIFIGIMLNLEYKGHVVIIFIVRYAELGS